MVRDVAHTCNHLGDVFDQNWARHVHEMVLLLDDVQKEDSDELIAVNYSGSGHNDRFNACLIILATVSQCQARAHFYLTLVHVHALALCLFLCTGLHVSAGSVNAAPRITFCLHHHCYRILLLLLPCTSHTSLLSSLRIVS